MNTVVVSIGSNIDPLHNIEAARAIISGDKNVISESSFKRTAPIGYEAQPDFINGCILVATEDDLQSFGDYLKIIEKRLGRVRTKNIFGPRTIDLDILIWNGQLLDDDYYEREFLQNAVAELLPEFRAPQRFQGLAQE